MSGFLQSTISTKKNDLCFLNIVLEKNKPTNNATSPLVNNSSVTPIQPSDIPKIILHIVEKTIALALHEINGEINIEITFSFLELLLLAIKIDGTLQPNPVIKLTTLLPLNPNLSKALSNKIEILDMIPTC